MSNHFYCHNCLTKVSSEEIDALKCLVCFAEFIIPNDGSLSPGLLDGVAMNSRLESSNDLDRGLRELAGGG